MSHTNQLNEIKLEVISKCPLHCIHCSSESSSACNEAVDPQQVERLVAEFVSLGGSQVQVSGGEPLEHPELLQILNMCHSEHLAVSLYTSGIRTVGGLCSIPPDQAANLRRYLRSIVFSIHGGTAEIHDQFSGISGSFEATVESLHVCAQARIDSAVHFVPTQRNFRSLPDLVALLKRAGVQRLSLLRFVPHGRGAVARYPLALNAAQLLEFRDMVESLSERYPSVRIRLGSPFSILQTVEVPRCNAGVDRMLISPTGIAYPCDAFKGFDIDDACRNVYVDGLERVWKHSEYFRKIRRMARLLPSACKECQHAGSCLGGCPAQRVFEAGSLDKNVSDPCCLMFPTLVEFQGVLHA